MRYFLTKVVFFWAVLTISGSVFADSVVLKNGYSLTGTILAEKQSQIVFDIGVTVLVIPKDEISNYEYASKKPQAETPATPQKPAESSKEHLYHTASLEKTTTEKCVDTFGESVVKVTSPAGLGSGFFINEDGFLITNYHVIERETRIEITVFEDGKKGFQKKNFKKVKIEAINPFMDLALLKVEDLGDTKVKYVYLGDMDKLRVGETVFAIGNPLGLERSVSQGIVSTKNREYQGLLYIQTTADINPGNSGGPLFNLAGEVVGVTNMGYIFLGGLGFAIPVDYVKHFINNRDAFAYDKDNPNTGFRYVQPGKRLNKNAPLSEKDKKRN